MITNRCPSEQAAQFNVRMPPALHEEIKKLAEQNERSMNSEILFHIKKGIEKRNEQPTTA